MTAAISMARSSRTPVTVGIVVNPASGRDIRRLISHASVFPAVEKANMVQRLLGALGALGIDRVMLMPDRSGICANVARAQERLQAMPGIHWPQLEILEMENEESARDTVVAVGHMVETGAAVIVVLGGDGTHRVAAAHCGDVPLATLSSGTNNVFPDLREATVTGLAAGLVARERVPNDIALRQNKVLRIASLSGNRPGEIALVDACVSTLTHVGARSLWQPETLTELAVAFAEADAIGLSSIAGMLRPVSREAPQGLYLRLAAPRSAAARMTVAAPVAPGLLAEVGVAGIEPLLPGQWARLKTAGGTVALDGEREIAFSEGEQLAVMLDTRGPRTIDVRRTLTWAARNDVFHIGRGSPANRTNGLTGGM